MREALAVYDRWAAEGKQVAVATVVRVQGSAPRPAGAKFLVSSAGDMEGSVSGGCVENDVFLHAQQVLERGVPRLVGYGIADEEAFEVGLACGGTIHVYVERWPDRIPAALRSIVEEERLGAVATIVDGADSGSELIIDFEEGVVAGRLPSDIGTAVLADARELMEREQSRVLAYGDRQVFIETVAPPPHLLIFGAVHIAQPLTTMAKELGFVITVCDARPAFATRERFPDAGEVLVGWPADLIDRLVLDRRTFVVILSHDARHEDPVLPVVLASPVRYVGAMGSRRTAAARRERLQAAGLSEEQISRIRGPVGLDIGAVTPAEVAVAILAEITHVRYGSGRAPELQGLVMREPRSPDV